MSIGVTTVLLNYSVLVALLLEYLLLLLMLLLLTHNAPPPFPVHVRMHPRAVCL